MSKNNELGAKGERIAVYYLKNNNYIIHDTNYRSGHAEIDIIASIEDTLVFIEVKTRRSTSYQFPEDSVSLKKEQNITLAAEKYIQETGYDGELSFDIITIIYSQKEFTLQHMKDAFFPY